MRNMDESAWTAGFMAGGIFAAQCPYVRGSFEALDWYGGWIEGAATALDHGDCKPQAATGEAATRRHWAGIRTTRH